VALLSFDSVACAAARSLGRPGHASGESHNWGLEEKVGSLGCACAMIASGSFLSPSLSLLCSVLFLSSSPQLRPGTIFINERAQEKERERKIVVNFTDGIFILLFEQNKIFYNKKLFLFSTLDHKSMKQFQKYFCSNFPTKFFFKPKNKVSHLKEKMEYCDIGEKREREGHAA
jgi:hypothetical protein